MSESRPIEVGYRKPPDTPRPGPTTRTKVTHVADGRSRPRSDTLATEEPCEIIALHRGTQRTITVTMRTPGNDFELAIGFLFGEGLIRGRDDIRKVSYCASGPPEQLYNQVSVEIADGVPFDADRVQRNFATSSSCGICGKASLEGVHVLGAQRLPEGPTIDGGLIPRLPEALRARQRIFEKTGGLHAAGIFDTDGSLQIVREDVGRHNAVDKAIGALVLAGEVPAHDRVLQVSGRTSFEIVQKAVVAGIPIVAAVSAPTSLAVHLAEEFGMTLAGFVRDESFNIYAGPSRIRLASATSSGTSTSLSADEEPP